MLDKLLKMDSALLTIKTQIAKYKALFAADGTIDAAEQATLDEMEANVKLIEPKLGKVIEKAKAAATEKPATTEKTEALAVGEVVVTEKAAGGMEELEAVPAMSGEETVPEEMGLNEKSINTLARLEELYDKLNIFSLFSNLYTNRFSPNLPITQRRGAYLDGLEGNLGIKEAFETAKEEFNSKKIQQSDISEYLKLFPESDSEAMQADKLRNFAALNARLLTVQNKLLPLFFEVDSIYKFCTEFGKDYLDFNVLLNAYIPQLNNLANSLIFQPELLDIINELKKLQNRFMTACNTQNAVIQELFKDFMENYGREDFFDFYIERLTLAQERAVDNGEQNYLLKLDEIKKNPEIVEKHLDLVQYEKTILPLFNEGVDFNNFRMDENAISPNDIAQGILGDCSFLAALGSVAQSNADLIRNLIVANNNGTYTVTLHVMQPNGQRVATEITVTNEMLFTKDGEAGYAGTGDDELWVMVLEKAFAKVMGGYDKIDVGVSPSEAIAVLTNREVNKLDMNSTSAVIINQLRQALQNNQVITIGSKNHDDSSIAENPNLRARFGDANNGFEVVVGNNLIVCDHQYSLISVNNNALNLRNPHGKNDITNLSIDDLKLYFSNIFIA